MGKKLNADERLMLTIMNAMHAEGCEAISTDVLLERFEALHEKHGGAKQAIAALRQERKVIN